MKIVKTLMMKSKQLQDSAELFAVETAVVRVAVANLKASVVDRFVVVR